MECIDFSLIRGNKNPCSWGSWGWEGGSSLISSKGPISSVCGEIRGHWPNNPCSCHISWFLLAFPSHNTFTPFVNTSPERPWPQQAAPSLPPPPGDFELSDLPGDLLETAPSSSEFSKLRQLYRKGHVCHLGKQGQTGTTHTDPVLCILLVNYSCRNGNIATLPVLIWFFFPGGSSLTLYIFQKDKTTCQKQQKPFKYTNKTLSKKKYLLEFSPGYQMCYQECYFLFPLLPSPVPLFPAIFTAAALSAECADGIC